MAGRLHLHSTLVEIGGESTTPEASAFAAAAFGCPVYNLYSASEFLAMAFDCEHRWLHVNSDWVILEPVDADYCPTPPGQPSHTVLLTNLANRLQPIIRYDLGDTITARPDPCPCGNPLPAIRVQGRRDDVLRLKAPDGRTVNILPLAIGSVTDETPGVQRSQLTQTGPKSLTLRLDVRSGAQPERVWEHSCADLAAYLAAQGLPDIEITRSPEVPQRSTTSGKFRQVIAVAPGK
jgi:phenylacetate-coenzyme A ligase PaaK-like adenylate-forming protein